MWEKRPQGGKWIAKTLRLRKQTKVILTHVFICPEVEKVTQVLDCAWCIKLYTIMYNGVYIMSVYPYTIMLLYFPISLIFQKNLYCPESQPIK